LPLKISVIIPTLNEDLHLRRLLEHFLTRQDDHIEIIIVDASKNQSVKSIAEDYHVKILECSSSRAKQMNLGAKSARHELLYFVHADTLPPLNFQDDFKQCLLEGYSAACYQSEFESDNKLLRINEFFTRFDWLVCRGGDQSLFIKKELFNELGRFDEQMAIMEEYPLIEKLLAKKQICVIPKPILISARKYADKSWLKVSRANYKAFHLYKKGVDSLKIKEVYSRLLS
jgi:rSAM/selenodomain-associated transferase 2